LAAWEIEHVVVDGAETVHREPEFARASEILPFVIVEQALFKAMVLHVPAADEPGEVLAMTSSTASPVGAMASAFGVSAAAAPTAPSAAIISVSRRLCSVMGFAPLA
jgi:hypothetical protein